MPSADAQYVMFGAYDLLHYALPDKSGNCGLVWLEQQHEERHALDWNCERHPVFLHCADEDYGHIQEILDPSSYADRPLVLTMARFVKHTLLRGELSIKQLANGLRQAIDDEFIDALMTDDPFDIVVVRELVVDLLASQLGVRLEERPRCTGGMADLAPGKISEILLLSDDLCIHVASPRVQV